MEPLQPYLVKIEYKKKIKHFDFTKIQINFILKLSNVRDMEGKRL